MVRQSIAGRAPDLALLDQSGQPLTLMALRGKVVLLTFTYSLRCSPLVPTVVKASSSTRSPAAASPPFPRDSANSASQ
jgi:cytochrome oxidase Cu insertion factor (SCO1/SenC/PrrC family)